MADTVTIYIDGQAFQVPQGANLVDAAKMLGITIPVFCYHPKLDPVGMCRMCLVELGSQMIDRETGKPELDEQGEVKVRWFPSPMTACTQTVNEGMVVRTTTDLVRERREDILEFLLTSHPLDCPICDKGGECPLQNLTMAYGPGESRFIFDDKINLAKHVPLGELIFLDRERCIQCARCTRFCDEIVGDDVLAFHERGRRLQIVTISDPPFDTIFSGNTTDICPVGALTTADFRFGARPWELDEVPSICPHCPVGCNISASTRLDRDAGGKKIIKRIMPRQNEQVNEIWICDKGRFGHHFTRSDERLTTPLIRQGDELVEASWDEAVRQVADRLRTHAPSVGFLAGPHMSNEDLWELRQLAEISTGSPQLGVWPATMSGGDLVAEVGVGVGTRLQDMGPESAILVIASDFEEEAPIWWLQVKQAADRGANVIVANARPTKLDQYAAAIVRYGYDEAVSTLNSLSAYAYSQGQVAQSFVNKRANGAAKLQEALKSASTDDGDAAEMLGAAENLVIFAGAEGLTLAEHAELMQAAANYLVVTGHVGRPNNGLVGVWPGPNMQGAFDLGYSADTTVQLLENAPKMWIIGESDPVGEDLRAAGIIGEADFVVVASQFMTETAAQADVVLPVQSFAEREGSFTNGMRRVQRFYTAQPEVEGTLPAWKAFEHVGAQFGEMKVRISAALVMREITQHVPQYADMSYPNLAYVEEQFPDVGGDDLYYGGTAYRNEGGLGVQWPTVAETQDAKLTLRPVKDQRQVPDGELLVVPVRVLYDRGPYFEKSTVMHHRVPAPYAALNQEDADRLNIADGDSITVATGDYEMLVAVRVDAVAPAGAVLLPMQLTSDAFPNTPMIGFVQKVEG